MQINQKLHIIIKLLLFQMGCAQGLASEPQLVNQNQSYPGQLQGQFQNPKPQAINNIQQHQQSNVQYQHQNRPAQYSQPSNQFQHSLQNNPKQN